MERYEYYAFRFLNQWYEDELELHSAISTKPDDATVGKALAFFQVSRNFPGLKKRGKLAFVTHSLQRVRDSHPSPPPSPIEAVNKLAETLKEEFARFNVSAASKLLWLSYRRPFIISDSRATKALKREFHHKRADASYEEYVNAWRKEFAKHKKPIRKAVDALRAARPFVRNCSTWDADLPGMVHKRWFVERVFDVLLWDIG